MASWTDDFSGTLSGFTVDQGSATVTGGNLRIDTGGFTDVIVRSNTACTGVSQYLKFTSATNDFFYPILAFRYVNSSSAFYLIYVEGNTGNVEWASKPNVSGSSTSIQTGTLPAAINNGNSVGMTVEGTGTNTIVRLWRNPTGDAPDDIDTWGGASPDLTFTNNPGTACDTGLNLTIGGTQSSANQILIASASGGDVGGGGGGSENTDGDSDGQGTATGVGAATVTANAASDGAATATGVGASTVSSVMNGAGTSDGTAVGSATVSSVMNGAGTSDGTAVGQSTVSAVMNGAGTSTAEAVGSSTGGGVSVEGAGYSRANSPFIILEWTAEGTATGYEVGYSQTSGSGNYTVVDVGNVTTYTLGPLAGGTWYYAVRSYDSGGTRGDWSTEATGYISTIAVAAGSSEVSAVMSSDGAATGTAVGSSTVSSVMNGAGTSTAEAVGTSTSNNETIGSSSGTSDGQAVGAVLVEAAGSSDGTSTNTAEGASTITAVSSSSGVAVGTAVGTTLEQQASTRQEGRRPKKRKDEDLTDIINQLTLYILRGEFGEVVYDRDKQT